ncbi:MAG: HlyD family efflux transporter periplasmic adaptor subunit [Hyphomicrobiaceae bacterium]|nr:HlyD family efflux transporter periplasmic adaptor subunit [Hyphomicrobiaceae bacterium]
MLTGPRFAGLLVAASVAVAAVAAHVAVKVPAGPTGRGLVISDVEPLAVRAGRAGAVARVLVEDGADVAAGDVLLTLDTRALDAELALVKAEAEAAQRRLADIRREADAVRAMIDRRVVERARLDTLDEARTAVAREADALNARIARAEAELARAVVRSPAAGRVRAPRGLLAGGSVEPDTLLFEILPATERVAVEARLPVSAGALLHHGAPARLSLTPAGALLPRTYAARVVWIAPAPEVDGARAEPLVRVRLQLLGPAPGRDRAVASELMVGSTVAVLLPAGEVSLIEDIATPLRQGLSHVAALRGEELPKP